MSSSPAYSTYSSFDSMPKMVGVICPHCRSRFEIDPGCGSGEPTVTCPTCFALLHLSIHTTVSIEVVSSTVPIAKEHEDAVRWTKKPTNPG